MDKHLPAIEPTPTDLRASYEAVVLGTLSSIRRHWRFIASSVALALALACIVIPVIPRKYSAVALVYPSLFSPEQGKNVARASIDGASVVVGEARLIVSDAVLHAVATRLGLESKTAESKRDAWTTVALDRMRSMFFPETSSYSAFDRTVGMLRHKIEVAKDTRSYVISVSFTADSADEAARVVNAVALEYARDKIIQRRRDATTAAEDDLMRQLAIYGEKHPVILQASDTLDVARAALKASLSEQDSGQEISAPDESVKLAKPNRTPTSPKGVTIVVASMFIALVAAIGLAIRCDQRDLDPRRLLLGMLWSRRATRSALQ